ncbi:MAG TPA: short-chain fatty acid transporter, partial [Aeromonadales bacterium]|nr:short-chain fatty acid transporter [Aeromonadales bacterium]
MIKTTAHFFTKIMQRWMPDAFVFAILLTFLVLFSGIIFENKSDTDMSLYWGDGVWNLLSFSMQMVVILVTGHILANTRLVDSILAQIARIGNSPTRAIIVTTMVATTTSWLNWGFGLVVGALIARKIAENSRGVHFPLLVAAAYSGFIVWHAGLSGSIPLKIATPGNDSLGQLLHQQAIPV